MEQLINFDNHLDELKKNLVKQDMSAQIEIGELYELLKPLIKQAVLLVQEYDVVITNPPYMPPSLKQKPSVQKNYPNSKSDLFAVFIEKCHDLTRENAYQAMITMHSWMFLSSFEKLRNKLLTNNTIINMAHMGARAFEDIGGEIVQTTAFVFNNANIKNYQSNFKRLVDYNSQDTKEIEYLKNTNLYTFSATNFSKIPGSPIAYWASNCIINSFSKYKKIVDIGESRSGMQTGNNNLFLRLWYEIDSNTMELSQKPQRKLSLKKWFPQPKGGSYRKWYGNFDYLVNFQNNGQELKKYEGTSIIKNSQFYFREGISWSHTTSSSFSARYMPEGCIFNVEAPSFYPNKEISLLYILAFFNSKILDVLFGYISQTMHYMAGDMAKIPTCITKNVLLISKIEQISKINISLSKTDWDSFETSWDFEIHPLVKNHVSTISEAYNLWSKECEDRFNILKLNEEELNRIFINIYGLQDELDPYEEEKNVTVRKADLIRDVKSFISYSVGCMFGRYSLDVEGLAYSGGEWDSSKYSSFIPDVDDIIPICDEKYFEDDIVTRFVEFVRTVYGSDNLEDNLSFIANALGGKGAPREVLRNYFLNDFFKDHCNTYQVTGSGKRPIYWLFDSGKKNGFKALVYIHRYTPDLIARMRTGYVHPQQTRYRTQIELLQSQIDEASSTSERVELSKQLKKINEQLLELNKYEEIVHHWADKMEAMDLDDGVKANYAKFQELLAKIK